MENNDARLIEGEEARIQAAYARRKDSFFYSWFNPSYVFMMQERERCMLEALDRHGFSSLKTKQILEIGCGTGYWLREFMKWGAQPENLTGVDLISDRVTMARHLSPESVKIDCGSAAALEFRDCSFDLVLQSTVFSSVLDPAVRRQIASEMLRVVKPGGALLWYDFHVNNPRNLDVRGITKRHIHELFPGCQIELNRITLAPPLVRFFALYSFVLCHFLEQFKILNTHYLGVIRKL